MQEIPRNRDEAVSYARKRAMGRNPTYFDFQKLGGDCTNFASQCIYAGVRIMNFTPILGRHYRSSYDRTVSWSGVEFLYNLYCKQKRFKMIASGEGH